MVGTSRASGGRKAYDIFQGSGARNKLNFACEARRNFVSLPGKKFSNLEFFFNLFFIQG